MCYSCGSCWNDFDPVQSPPVVLRCRHIFCSQCANRFVHDGSSCPFRCNDTPLRNRDIRPLHVSVVSTTEADDAQAVQHAIQGQARLLRHHKESAAAMESQVGGLLARVTNQSCSLFRYHSALGRILRTRLEALETLADDLVAFDKQLDDQRRLNSDLDKIRIRIERLIVLLQRAKPHHFLEVVGRLHLPSFSALDILAITAVAVLAIDGSSNIDFEAFFGHTADATTMPTPDPPMVQTLADIPGLDTPSSSSSTLVGSPNLSSTRHTLAAIPASEPVTGKRLREDEDDDGGPSSKRANTM